MLLEGEKNGKLERARPNPKKEGLRLCVWASRAGGGSFCPPAWSRTLERKPQRVLEVPCPGHGHSTLVPQSQLPRGGRGPFSLPGATAHLAGPFPSTPGDSTMQEEPPGWKQKAAADPPVHRVSDPAEARCSRPDTSTARRRGDAKESPDSRLL